MSAPRPSPGAGGAGAVASSRAGAGRGRVLAVLALLAAGANMPSPLYPGMQVAFGFSDLTMTAVYATYALVSVPALLLLGPLGDRLPARPVLRGGVIAGIAGSLCLAFGDATGWLIAGRAAHGLALGAVTGVGMALVARRAPTAGGHGASAAAGTAAFVLGSAAGPAATGVLAQYAPAPQVLPFLLHVLLLVGVLVGLGRVPSRGAGPPRAEGTGASPVLDHAARRALLVAAGNGFLGWSVVGLFLGLIPSLLGRAGNGGAANLAVTGVLAGAVLACSALAPQLVRRLGARRAQLLGLAAVVPPLVALLLGGSSVAVVLGACVIGGLGHGLLYGGAAQTATAATPPARASATTATLYVAFYLGAGLPALAAGLLTMVLDLPAATALIAAGALLGALGLLEPTRRLPCRPRPRTARGAPADGARRRRRPRSARAATGAARSWSHL